MTPLPAPPARAPTRGPRARSRVPWIAPGFLAAGRVTLIAGDAYRAAGPLALVWAAALATGRPVGAFAPLTRLRSVVYDATAYYEPQRRKLADAAARLGAPTPDAHEGVRLIRPCDDKPLFCRPLRGANGALRSASALADLERHIVTHEAALLVLSPASSLVAGGFSADWEGFKTDAIVLARRLVASLTRLAKRHRLAVLLVHDDPNPAQPLPTQVVHELTKSASIVFSLTRLTKADARVRPEAARQPRGPRQPRPVPRLSWLEGFAHVVRPRVTRAPRTPRVAVGVLVRFAALGVDEPSRAVGGDLGAARRVRPRLRGERARDGRGGPGEARVNEVRVHEIHARDADTRFSRWRASSNHEGRRPHRAMGTAQTPPSRQARRHSSTAPTDGR